MPKIRVHPSLWHNIKVGFPCGVAGGILIVLIGGPYGYALGAATTLALVLTATSVDRFLRFDYGHAVQAGLDHDRLGDLLRLLDWEIARTQRTIGRSLLGPLAAVAVALGRVGQAFPSHHD